MKFPFLIFLLLFLIIGSITEYYLQYIGLGDPVRYDSDYIYGYSPKENQKKSRLENSTVTINDVGLRSVYKWKNSSKKKILFIGDSITYGGSYIDDKDVFTHLVCKNLDEYICGNAGVNAYSIMNMVMRSKYDERINDAEIVVFLFAPGDFYREYADSMTAHFYLNNKKFFFPAIIEAISFVATKYDINRFISKKDDSNKKHIKNIVNFSVDILFEEVERLKRTNKKVLLFYSIEKNDKNSRNKINKFILEEIKKKEFKNFYSLENVLVKDIYFYDSVHYSKSGHEIVSKKIYEIIKKSY